MARSAINPLSPRLRCFTITVAITAFDAKPAIRDTRDLDDFSALPRGFSCAAEQAYKLAPSHCLPQGEGQGITEPYLARGNWRVECLADVVLGSFATDAAGLACRLMSASVRGRPTCGVTAK